MTTPDQFAAEPERYQGGTEQDRCEVEGGHDWEWISDWMGDPNVINGTQDLSRWECSKCGAQSNRARNDPPGGRDA